MEESSEIRKSIATGLSLSAGGVLMVFFVGKLANAEITLVDCYMAQLSSLWCIFYTLYLLIQDYKAFLNPKVEKDQRKKKFIIHHSGMPSG